MLSFSATGTAGQAAAFNLAAKGYKVAIIENSARHPEEHVPSHY